MRSQYSEGMAEVSAQRREWMQEKERKSLFSWMKSQQEQTVYIYQNSEDEADSLTAASNESNWEYPAPTYTRSAHHSEPHQVSNFAYKAYHLMEPGNSVLYDPRNSDMTRETDLNASFKINSTKSFQRFFTVGEVFQLLWSEPGRNNENRGDSNDIRVMRDMDSILDNGTSPHDRTGFNGVRRFVIVNHHREGYSVCLPIHTYAGHGTRKIGAAARDHAIIYTREPPRSLGFCTNPVTKIEVTSKWILDSVEYQTWRNQTGGSLWIVGKLGSGKSIAMSTINNHLESEHDPDESIIYYCLDADTKEGNPSIAILGIIIIELLHRVTGNRREVLQRLLSALACAGNRLSMSRMTSIFLKIKHSLGSHERLCVLVDGLDTFQYDKHEQDVLLGLLAHLSRYDPYHHTKCAISSRLEYLDRVSFMGGLQIDLDTNPAHRESVDQYIRTSMKGWNIDQDTEVVGRLIEATSYVAAGPFLWACLAIEDLRISIYRSQEPIWADEIVASLGTLGLHTLYGRMLNRIEDCDRTAAISMLRWVTYAARSLHAEELMGALRAETGFEIEKSSIVRVSGGFLCMDGDGIIRLVHSSVRDYLQLRMKQTWKEVSDEANEVLAHACLKVLGPGLLLQSLRLRSQSYARRLEVEACLDQPSSFEDYAQSNWVYHYRLAESASKDLAGLLHSLLETSLKMVHIFQPKDTRSGASHMLTIRQMSFSDGEHGSIVNLLDPYNTGLLIGARFGFFKLTKLELEMGADTNVVCGAEELTPLIWASIGGHTDVFELLLQYDANTEFRTRSGNDVLMYTIANGYDQIFRLLLEHKRHGMNSNKNESTPANTEDVSLTVSFEPACDACSAFETVYELHFNPQKDCNGVDNESPDIPLIVVKGEFISRHEIDQASSYRSTTLKWLGGPSIHLALSVAASLGIEVVKRLLVAAGNDVEILCSSSNYAQEPQHHFQQQQEAS